jgi:hypothetical protein
LLCGRTNEQRVSGESKARSDTNEAKDAAKDLGEDIVGRGSNRALGRPTDGGGFGRSITPCFR